VPQLFSVSRAIGRDETGNPKSGYATIANPSLGGADEVESSSETRQNPPNSAITGRASESFSRTRQNPPNSATTGRASEKFLQNPPEPAKFRQRAFRR
jgi:hypothetical protein